MILLRCGPANRRRLDLHETVTLLVGPSKEKFTVLKLFLVKSSDFFKACCKEGAAWVESETKTIEMPEEDPKIFSAYLQWLYTQELVIFDGFNIESVKDADLKTTEEAACLAYDRLVQFAMLADRLVDSAFNNEIVNNFISIEQASEFGMSTQTKVDLHSALPENSPIRRLMVRLTMQRIDTDYLNRRGKDLSQEFAVDLLRSYAAMKEAPGSLRAPVWRNRCDFHLHADGEPSCA